VFLESRLGADVTSRDEGVLHGSKKLIVLNPAHVRWFEASDSDEIVPALEVLANLIFRDARFSQKLGTRHRFLAEAVGSFLQLADHAVGGEFDFGGHRGFRHGRLKKSGRLLFYSAGAAPKTMGRLWDYLEKSC
jgi:hypothetical protein